MAYVLTMLYLSLFAVLAVGFAAASMSAVETARTERLIADSRSASESGMHYARYILEKADDPRDFVALADSLARQLAGAAALRGHDLKIVDGAIVLPAPDEAIDLDPAAGTRFRLALRPDGAGLIVRSTGFAGEISRSIELRFARSGNRLAPEPQTYKEVVP